MAGLLIHIVVYAVVNALLVLIWLVTGHTWDELSAVRADPLQAVKDGFWPLYVMVAWGAGLLIHAGTWLALTLFGGRRRRARRQERHEHRHRHHRPTPPPVQPAPPVAPLPAGATVPTHDLTRQATKVAMGLVESLANRVATPKPSPAAEAAAGGRQWVVVMFTDIAGSTDLTETLGDDTWRRLLAEHRALVRSHIAEHRGAEVGTQGDGFLVRFDAPGDAVACASAIQRSLAGDRAAGTFALRVRIGIHAGEAVHEEGDLVGRVINLASRVTATADPDEILVTEPVADHLPPGVRLVDRGLRPLKGVAQPRHLLAVAWGAHEDDPTVVLDEEHT